MFKHRIFLPKSLIISQFTLITKLMTHLEIEEQKFVIWYVSKMKKTNTWVVSS